MGVPLQLILGILLAQAICSCGEEHHLRQIREAPPPLPTPAQNVTEINNRDLNKIVKDNPKTEALDSKSKNVNNLNNFEEFPIKLGKSEEDHQNNVHSVQKNETEEDSKEDDEKHGVAKLPKEKLREDNSRAIDIDASKFWSSDFHSKNNVFTEVFTLLPTQKGPTARSSEENFGRTRHPSFENSAELTTPTTKLFDQKFKETVESVEQKLDDVDIDSEETDSEEEESNDENLSVEDMLNTNPENSSLQVEKSKTIVNNETIDKNSIHKDVHIEQTKKVNFENIFNETKVYDDEKGENADRMTENIVNRYLASTTTAAPILTTRKSSLLKVSVEETGTSHLLSNNIETDFVHPLKSSTRTTTSSIPSTFKGDVNDLMLTTTTPSSQTAKTESATTSTITTSASVPTSPVSVIRMNVSDQENIIPLYLGTESVPIKKSSSEPTTTIGISKVSENPQNEVKTAVERISPDVSGTTTSKSVPTIINRFDIITDVVTTSNILSDSTTVTMVLPEESTTTFVIENTTEVSDPTTTVPTSTAQEEITDYGLRTSKSLDNLIVTEQMVKTSEKIVESVTKEVDVSTESTLKNELDSTTLNNGKMEESDNKDNIIRKAIETTTAKQVYSTTADTNGESTTFSSFSEVTATNETTTENVLETSQPAIFVTGNSTEEPVKINTTTVSPTSIQSETQLPTTSEFTFVHIEHTASNHTTLLPEILSPNQNYSTSMAPENEANEIRKIVLNSNATEDTSSSSSSTSPSSTSEEPVTNVTTTTEDITDSSPTENSFTKDGDGGNKGKIAAIAISSVGAVCLILLAGLLYVMKKRQRRLNYGPRCRPVSLDDYSIDNLSVYNSVRRKGGARMSKRSFGNPAFEDPVAPTHPLNFPALAKFSTNFEDIKAEFEEIPQITARTSELPDGCDTKNRYANVIPLPETRVFLNPIDGYPNSDYINANYVTGPKNVKGYYIATQGPMQNTVDDFWRMVWEQQAKLILMLTHLVENGLEKCVDYLPESEVLECSRLFGDFQITLKKREVKEKYIISSLQLKNMVSNSWREVTHFWYLGWPEKGVPSEANSLIAFLIEARSYMKIITMDKNNGINGNIHNGGAHNEHNPVVIHCSPGTGRTGVAIACDIAIREFETTRLIDVPKIVYKIRRDRANAIQTKEQYMFIYKVVSLYATKLTGGALENF